MINLGYVALGPDQAVDERAVYQKNVRLVLTVVSFHGFQGAAAALSPSSTVWLLVGSRIIMVSNSATRRQIFADADEKLPIPRWSAAVRLVCRRRLGQRAIIQKAWRSPLRQTSRERRRARHRRPTHRDQASI